VKKIPKVMIKKEKEGFPEQKFKDVVNKAVISITKE